MAKQSNREQNSAFQRLSQSIELASAPQRIGMLFVALAAIGVPLMFMSLFGVFDSNEATTEEVGSSSITSFKTKEDKEQGIIRDGDTLEGKLVVLADDQRVKSEASKGQSSFSNLVASSSLDSQSPYEVLKVDEEDMSDKNKNISLKDKLKLAEKERQEKRAAKREERKKQEELEREKAAKRQEIMDIVKGDASGLSKHANSSQEKKIRPGGANVHSANELKRDSYAGMSLEQYQTALHSRAASYASQMTANYAQVIAKQQTTSGIQLISTSTPQVNGREIALTGGGTQAAVVSPSSSIGSKSSPSTTSTGSTVPPMLLQPGDYIVASNIYPVDSRIPGPFIVVASQEPFKDARIKCSFTDTGDFIIPVCSEITMMMKSAPLEAVSINPRNLSRIVDQDIDDDLLMKLTARVGTKILQTWGTRKLQSGTTTTTDADTNQTTTNNNLTDREILLGATASSVGDLVTAAESYYSKSSVKTIPANTTFMISMIAPLPDWWGVGSIDNHYFK